MKRHFVRSNFLLAGAAVLALMTAGEASAGLSNGDAITAVLTACPGPFSNHGQAQSCATQELNDLKNAGQITGQQKGMLNSTIATAIQCQGGVCAFSGLNTIVSAAFNATSVDMVQSGIYPIPDGTLDDVIDVTIIGAIKNISVLFLNSDYTCKAGQVDTIVGAFTAGMTCFYTGYSGADTYVLGVSTDGGDSLVNNPDGSINPLSYGTHTLKLYGPGFGPSETWYKLAVEFADGTVLSSAPIQKP